jgi:four helix bundle protein
MQSDITVPGPFPTAEATVPDPHKLTVYHVAVAFQAAAMNLLPKGHAVLRHQVERASLSIVLNLADGAGRRSRRGKGRSYAIARGRAMESLALIDVLIARQNATADAAMPAKGLGIRVAQMLTKLQQAMAGNGKNESPRLSPGALMAGHGSRARPTDGAEAVG